MPNLTIPEVEADLINTINDEEVCRQIASLVARFINESGGEDRSIFRKDLMKWQVLGERAADLRVKIRTKLQELKEAQP